MIGYGDLVPRTEAGKIATIVYAVFGIPVYILYFMNMGKVFAAILKWVYTKAYRWNVRRKWKQSANYDPMANAGEDIELDEAYHYELSQKVGVWVNYYRRFFSARARAEDEIRMVVHVQYISGPRFLFHPRASPSLGRPRGDIGPETACAIAGIMARPPLLPNSVSGSWGRRRRCPISRIWRAKNK